MEEHLLPDELRQPVDAFAPASEADDQPAARTPTRGGTPWWRQSPRVIARTRSSEPRQNGDRSTERHRSGLPPVRSRSLEHRQPSGKSARTRSIGPEPAVAQIPTPIRLFKMRRQRVKKLWQFIHLAAKSDVWYLADHELLNEHAEFAYCLKCKCRIFFRVGNHHVLDHMTKYHKHVLVEFENKKRHTDEDDGDCEDVEDDGEDEEKLIQRNLKSSFAAVAKKKKIEKKRKK
ncbi:hypothetical protein FI667_g15658, partial [Globisporangium splendens]